jgi:hypothetical protein
MIDLKCLLFGENSTITITDIDENKKDVYFLAEKIKEKKPDTIQCEADKIIIQSSE